MEFQTQMLRSCIIKKKQVSDTIYYTIREGIATGLLPMGTRLREEELAEVFDVSRTPVREALKKLELERLIDCNSINGTVVRSLSVDECLDTLEVLELLRENLDGEEFKIDHPRRTLEEFFLDVISQARSESVETAGVAGGSGIAEYLTGADPDDKNAVLDSLLKENVTASASPAAVPEVQKIEKSASAEDDKLASVLGGNQPAQAVVEEKNIVAEDAENMRRANDKLDSLLGGKSSGE